MATEADALAVAALGKAFAAEAATGFAFSAPYAAEQAARCAEGPGSAVVLWEAEGRPVGALALAVGPHPLFPIRWAQELLWWVEPAHRGHAARPMLRAAEAWARDEGAAVLALSSLDDRAGLLMGRLGYEASPERRWLRRL